MHLSTDRIAHTTAFVTQALGSMGLDIHIAKKKTCAYHYIGYSF